MSKSIVTGGAGFIGSHLVGTLIKRNEEVVVIDNLSTGNKKFVNKKATFIKGDLKDFDFCLRNIKDADYVYHLAANGDVREGAKDSKLHFNENVIVTYNVLEAMRINNIKNIVFTSTSTVYGEAKKIPTPENYGPLIPISLYAASKLCGESLICAYSSIFDLNAWIYRFANVIGLRETRGVLIDFIKKLNNNPNELEVLGDGTQTKSYIYISDCIEGFLHGIESKGKVNIFNIGSEDYISVREIAEILIDEMKIKAKIRYTGGKRGWKGDVPKMLLDITKLKKIGWASKYNSKESIKKTIGDLLGK